MSFGFSIGDFLAVLQLANKLRKDFSTAPQQCQVIAADITNIDIILQNIQQSVTEHKFDRSQETQLADIIANCKTVLTSIEEVVSKYTTAKSGHSSITNQARKTLARLKWNSDEIDQFHGQLNTTLTILNAFILNLGRNETFELVSRQHQQDNEAILDWLAPRVYDADHSTSLERRLPATGQWFLDSLEYTRWMRSASSDVLLLRGIPGAGKTVLSSIIIDDLQTRYGSAKDIAICFYYCSYTRETKEQAPGRVLRCLLRQILQSEPVLPLSIKELYSKYGKSNMPATLKSLMDAFHMVTGIWKRVYIVIDALDECTLQDGYQQTLIKELIGLDDSTNTNTIIKILATSRPSPDIEAGFSGYKILDILADDKDIGNYIVANIPLLHKSVSKHPKLSEEIINAVVSSAGGIFLLARLHIEALKQKMTIGDIKRTLRSLGSGPAGYTKAYAETMHRVRSQGERGVLAMNALMWIVYGERLLTCTELLHALATMPGSSDLDEDDIPDIDDILSACCGLAVLEHGVGIVRLVHRTTQEFFKEHGSDWFEDPHTKLSDVCLTYLKFKENVGNDGIAGEDLHPKTLHLPLWDYAFLNWQYHVTVREKPIDMIEVATVRENLEISIQNPEENETYKYLKYSYDHPGIKGLHLASHRGLTSVMLQFLEHHDIDAVDSFGRTPLSYAVDHGQYAAVDLLLQKGARVDIPCGSENTLLLYAIKSPSPVMRHVLDLLIGARAAVNVPDANGITPLLHAVYNLDVVLTLLLLTNGANPEVLDHDGRSVLSHAVDWTSLNYQTLEGNLANLLSEHSFRVLVRSYQASKRRNRRITEDELKELARSIGIESFLIDGSLYKWLALKASDQFNKGEKTRRSIIKLLLTHGSDPTCLDKTGRSPLSYSAEQWSMMSLELLIEKVLKTELPIPGTTRKLSVEHIRRLNASDKVGCSPFSYAAQYGASTTLELMVNVGFPIGDSDSTGRTALSYAATLSAVDSVEFLLIRHAQVDAVDNLGRSPLLWTVDSSYKDDSVVKIAQLLIENGADVNVQDTSGQTALHIATLRGHGDLVRLLRAKSAQLKHKDNSGCTALYYAIQKFLLSGDDILDHFHDTDLLLNGDEADQIINFLSTGRISSEHIKLLLRFGVCLGMKLYCQRTLLDYTILKGSSDVIERALKPQVLEGDFTTNSWSSLHWACWRGDTFAIKLLIDAKIEYTKVQTYEPRASWTPLDVFNYYLKIGGYCTDTDSLDILGSEDRDLRGTLRSINETAYISSVKTRLKTTGKMFRASYNTSSSTCDGCSLPQIGSCYLCNLCKIKYCFMCKHDLDDLHPEHRWEMITSPSWESRLFLPLKDWSSKITRPEI